MVERNNQQSAPFVLFKGLSAFATLFAALLFSMRVAAQAPDPIVIDNIEYHIILNQDNTPTDEVELHQFLQAYQNQGTLVVPEKIVRPSDQAEFRVTRVKLNTMGRNHYVHIKRVELPASVREFWSDRPQCFLHLHSLLFPSNYPVKDDGFGERCAFPALKSIEFSDPSLAPARMYEGILVSRSGATIICVPQATLDQHIKFYVPEWADTIYKGAISPVENGYPRDIYLARSTRYASGRILSIKHAKHNVKGGSENCSTRRAVYYIWKEHAFADDAQFLAYVNYSPIYISLYLPGSINGGINPISSILSRNHQRYERPFHDSKCIHHFGNPTKFHDFETYARVTIHKHGQLKILGFPKRTRLNDKTLTLEYEKNDSVKTITRLTGYLYPAVGVPDPGYKVDYYVLNGHRIDADTVFLLPIEASLGPLKQESLEVFFKPGEPNIWIENFRLSGDRTELNRIRTRLDDLDFLDHNALAQVTTLDKQAFRDQYALRNLLLPDKIEELPDDFGQALSSLKLLVLRSSSLTLKPSSLAGMSALKDLYVASAAPSGISLSELFGGTLPKQLHVHVPASHLTSWQQIAQGTDAIITEFKDRIRVSLSADCRANANVVTSLAANPSSTVELNSVQPEREAPVFSRLRLEPQATSTHIVTSWSVNGETQTSSVHESDRLLQDLEIDVKMLRPEYRLYVKPISGGELTLIDENQKSYTDLKTIPRGSRLTANIQADQWHDGTQAKLIVNGTTYSSFPVTLPPAAGHLNIQTLIPAKNVTLILKEDDHAKWAIRHKKGGRITRAQGVERLTVRAADTLIAWAEEESGYKVTATLDAQSIELPFTFSPVEKDHTLTLESQPRTYLINFSQDFQSRANVEDTQGNSVTDSSTLYYGDTLTITPLLPPNEILVAIKANGNELAFVDGKAQVVIQADTELSIETQMSWAMLTVRVTPQCAVDLSGPSLEEDPNRPSTRTTLHYRVPVGSTVKANLLPAKGYMALGVTLKSNGADDEELFASEVEFTASDMMELIPEVVVKLYTLSYNDSIRGGGLEVKLEDSSGIRLRNRGMLPHGARITVTAIPNAGYSVDNLLVNGTIAQSPARVEITGPTTIDAQFSAVECEATGNFCVNRRSSVLVKSDFTGDTLRLDSPDYVTIGSSSFTGNRSIVFASIAGKVIDINPYAFSQMTSLQTVRIAENVREIGAKVFSGCLSLQRLELEHHDPKDLDIAPDALEVEYLSRSDFRLIVPAGTREAYLSDPRFNGLTIAEKQITLRLESDHPCEILLDRISYDYRKQPRETVTLPADLQLEGGTRVQFMMRPGEEESLLGSDIDGEEITLPYGLELLTSHNLYFRIDPNAQNPDMPTPVLTAAKSLWRIYPTPASQTITLENIAMSPCRYTIRTIRGQLVKRGSMSVDRKEIDISGLPQGVYLMEISNESESEVLRFVKE